VCVVAALIPQQLYVLSRNGYGAGDLYPFVFWGVAFALLLGAFGLGWAWLTSGLPLVVRGLLGGIIGAGSGLLWTVIVRLLLGGWFGAFSFPVVYFWTIGGCFGLIFASLFGKRRLAVGD
jgi:hypothetical protein